MALAQFAFREGSPDGNIIYLVAPVYTGVENLPDSVAVRSGGTLVLNYNEIISYDTTFLCANDSVVAKMLGQGFTYLINLNNTSENSPYRLYWGNNYIDCYRNSSNGISIVYYDVGNHRTFSVQPGANTLTDAAFSIPAVQPKSITQRYCTIGWRLWAWTELTQEPNTFFEWLDSQYQLFEYLRDFYSNTPNVDPYVPGPINGPDGGGGVRVRRGTVVPHAELPTISALDAGFITLFAPTAGQLKLLAKFMWTNPLFDLTNWKRIFADPMDAILGLSIVPLSLSGGGSDYVTVGNISTNVNMDLAPGQYQQVDCGYIEIPEQWGAYLDYDPYTKIEIYLPYCGTHALSADDVMNKKLHLWYNIDILSGACAAQLEADGTTLYTFIGQCASSIPITGGDWTNMINGVLSAAVSIGSLVATGGATAPTAIPQLAATAVNGIKPNIEKSGAMGGTGGMLAIQTPYLILTVPQQALPKNQNKYLGYPSFITTKLEDLSGYTEVEKIHLENVPATQNELNEIVNKLKEGVIF